MTNKSKRVFRMWTAVCALGLWLGAWDADGNEINNLAAEIDEEMAINGEIEPLDVQPDAALDDPRSAEISIMKDSEELRRLAYERHGRERISEANQAYLERRFSVASQRFREALNAFREAGYRAETEVERLRAQNGLRESIYMEAVVLRNQGDYEQAGRMALQALQQGHPLAGELSAQIKRDMEPQPEPEPPPPPRRWESTRYQERQQELTRLMTQAREYFLTGELDSAQQHLEGIVRRDPYHAAALDMMERVARRKKDLSTMETEYTRREMIAAVRDAWNRRDYAIDEERMPLDVTAVTPDPVDRPDRAIRERMRQIVIPQIEFRQANIHDVIEFLHRESRAHDVVDEEERAGINIILNLGRRAMERRDDRFEPDDIFALDPDPDPRRDPDVGDVPLITFSARRMSLYEALSVVTDMAGLKFRIEGSVVLVVPQDAPDGPIIHRSYPVMGTLIEQADVFRREVLARDDDFRRPADRPDRTEREGLREVFAQMGVDWPAGSFIRHVPSIGRLMVANTANNLAVFEEKLALLNVVPNQIEIETRFVEVRQSDMQSLGFEWGLTDDWQIAQRTDMGGPGLAGQPRVQMQRTGPGGFSKGQRFARDARSGVARPDDLFTISSVLTNPELSFTLHALQQKGNVDLLSAPKVTTRSGDEATIKVVTEYIYPTSFNVEPITAGTGEDLRIVGGIVEPSNFQTREVGVILSVMPEVSPEGHMINLMMTPEVVTEPEWKNYGSVYIDDQGQEQQLNMEQPFFHSRTITTQILIFNGATVVMGGMINEHREEVDDKVPFFGDIPLIGRLFRSRYEHSEKRNLLIFVTARLVDPAGRPIERRDDEALAAQRTQRILDED